MNKDITLPQVYSAYFQNYGRCRHCGSPLRHYLHAFNHYKKYHYEDKPRYFIFVMGKWQECGMAVCLNAIQHHQCWAITKPQHRKES